MSNPRKPDRQQQQKQQVTSSSDDSSSAEDVVSAEESDTASDEAGSDISNNETNNSENDMDRNENDDESGDQVIGSFLLQDMRLCQQDDPSLFLFLLPFALSSNFAPAFMVNNSELVYLIVSCVDSKQLKDLVSAIISQDVVLLRQPEVVKQTVASKRSMTAAAKRQTKNTAMRVAGGAKAGGGTSGVINKKRKRNSGNFLKVFLIILKKNKFTILISFLISYRSKIIRLAYCMFTIDI